MKKIVVITSVFIVINYIYAQEYVPMPTSNAIWCEYNAIWTGGFNPDIYPHYMIQQGDTVINNIEYYKIIQSFNDTIFGNSNDFYRGCFREDSGRKVYLILKDSLQEVIIYDFSKDIGDTVYIIGGNLGWKTGYDTTLFIIDYIDSILIDGNYRKKFSFDESNLVFNFDWIEGIGSMGGLFHSFYPFGIEQRYELNCLSHYGSFVFQNPDSWLNDCFVFTGIEPINEIKQDILVYPNPSSGLFYLECGFESQYIINIYSGLGDLIYKEKLNTSQNPIDLSNMKSGLYILKVYNPEIMKFSFEKIILKND